MVAVQMFYICGAILCSGSPLLLIEDVPSTESLSIQFICPVMHRQSLECLLLEFDLRRLLKYYPQGLYLLYSLVLTAVWVTVILDIICPGGIYNMMVK